MKIKVQATIVYEWEEDSVDWPDDDITTEAELIAAVQRYVDHDLVYILECDPKTIGKIEVAHD